MAESLSDIYNDWLYAQNVMTVLKRNFQGRDLYEAKNIMERYLISYYNEDPNAEKKMMSEFREKGIQWFPYEKRNVSPRLFDIKPQHIKVKPVLVNDQKISDQTADKQLVIGQFYHSSD